MEGTDQMDREQTGEQMDCYTGALISECQIKTEVVNDDYEMADADRPHIGPGFPDSFGTYLFNMTHIKTEPADSTNGVQLEASVNTWSLGNEAVSEHNEINPEKIKSEICNYDGEYKITENVAIGETSSGDNADTYPTALSEINGEIPSASVSLEKDNNADISNVDMLEEESMEKVTDSSEALFPVALYKIDYQPDISASQVNISDNSTVNTLGYKISMPNIEALCKSALAEKPENKSPAKKEYKYKCAVCAKTFPKKNKLDRHIRTHTGEKPFKCTTCERAFADNRNLKTHLRIHSGEKPYKCTYCDKAFTQGSSLRIHTRVHTNERPYNCTACEKTFRQARNLQLHMRTHTGEKPHQCPQCGEYFRSSSNLQSHYRRHTGEKPFTCGQCQKSFAQSNVLQAHLRTHSGEKPYQCYVCLKHFGGRGYLRTHMRIHTQEKPFQCTVCEKSFSIKSVMQKHCITHTGVKEHHCPLCNKAFTQKSSVKKHLKTHEEENLSDFHHIDDPRIIKMIDISDISNAGYSNMPKENDANAEDNINIEIKQEMV